MKAKELPLIGDIVDAHSALRLGMADRVVTHDDLAECERALLKLYLPSQVEVIMTKLAVNKSLECMGFMFALQYNIELIVHLGTTTGPEQQQFNRARLDHGLRSVLG